MTTELVTFDNLCLLLEKRMPMPEIYYITVLLFLHQMEAIMFNILQIFFNMWEKLL